MRTMHATCHDGIEKPFVFHFQDGKCQAEETLRNYTTRKEKGDKLTQRQRQHQPTNYLTNPQYQARYKRTLCHIHI